MIETRFFGAALIAASVTGLAGPAAAVTWECKASQIQNYSYDGGDSAYIHLAPFQRGSNYPVTVSKDGKKATGVTANGTPFTCTKKG